MQLHMLCPAFLRLCYVVLWALPNLTVLASKNVSTSPPSSPSVPPSASTCAFGTVNYITHSLPQQCLTTSWEAHAASSVSISESSIASAGLTTTNTSHVHSASETSGPGTQAAETPSTSDLHDPTLNAPETSSAIANTHTATPQSASEDRTPSSDEQEQETDAESPLDNAKFLSFEDWKRQALAKADQAAERLESVRAGTAEPRRRPGGINNALDSLGEDSEIELDFPGFVPEDQEPTAWGRQLVDGATDSGAQDDPNVDEGKVPRPSRRSKDAGKTCKERFNYASFDCAANVLKYNQECSGSSSVLVENKDSYMLNECTAKNKFFIVELCNDILIDTIVLANFEFFSSIFRTFRVSVSDRYPVKLDKWKVLGTYEARNSREVQAFLIENPLIWARYLRIEFLTHYGNEYYCPVSLLRVHGTTAYEELKHEGESSRVEDEVDQDTPESLENGEQLSPEAVAEPIMEETRSALEKAAVVSENEHQIPVLTVTETSSTSTSSTAGPDLTNASSVCAVDEPFQEKLSFLKTFNTPLKTCDPGEGPLAKETLSQPIPTSTNTMTSFLDSDAPTPSANSPLKADRSSIISSLSEVSTTGASAKNPKSSSSSASSIPRSASQTASGSVKTTSSATQPQPANPTTQESFLKSIHKRLQMLETNSTLSLLYIEEQSRNLRDAFNRVEKRQLSKTSTFLENLNVTVLSELRDFRQQYDQIWQSTVIELENQRESYRREVHAITARLSVLADEVVFQKRMSIVQSILILICLVLVLFAKGSAANYLELPLMQNMLARSQSSFFRASSPTFETPSGSPSSTRPNSSYTEKRPMNFFRRHKRGLSDESRDDALGPIIQYSPPTPTSDTGPSDPSMEDEQPELSRTSSPDPGVDPTIRPMSSPPTLEATKLNTTSTWPESDSEVTKILTPPEALETPPRHPSFDSGQVLNGMGKVLQTPPDS